MMWRRLGWGAIAMVLGCSDPADPECVDGNLVACDCPGGGRGEALCVDGELQGCTCAPEDDAGPRDAAVPPDGFVPNDGGGTTAACRDLGPVRAFPGAVGYGAGTVGGRGGDILIVDNLDDSGPGSLREAIEASGPRTVLFRVTGTITLLDSLRITNGEITIAGESAPGGGIALRTDPSVTTPTILSSASDVVIRHLRVRPGPSDEPSNLVDAITVTAGERIVLANNSFSWSTDENVNLWYDASDVTVQDNIISEGLMNSTHTYGTAHSKGFIAGPDNARMTIVGNLFAFNDDRNPLVGSAAPYEIVNNVVYDGYQVGTSLGLRDGAQVNLIGNVYLPGPDYRPSRYQIIVAGADDMPLLDGAIFAADNLSPRTDPEDDWAVMGWGGVHGGDYNGSPLPESVRADTAFPMSAYPVEPSSSEGLVDRMLPVVGASRPARDAVDARIVEDVVAGTGGLIDHPDEVGGWPALAPGEAPADADRDGLPDAWEAERGLDPDDASDAWADRDGDGWTNLEEFLACS